MPAPNPPGGGVGAIKNRDCDHGVAATNSPTFAGTGPTCRGGGSGRHSAGSVPSEGWISPAGAMPSTNLPAVRGRGATPHTHLVARWLRLQATGREMACLQRGIPPAFIPPPLASTPPGGWGRGYAHTSLSPHGAHLATGHPAQLATAWEPGKQAGLGGEDPRPSSPSPGTRRGGPAATPGYLPISDGAGWGASCPPYKRIPGRPPAAPLAGAAPLKRDRHRNPREGAAR